MRYAQKASPTYLRMPATAGRLVFLIAALLAVRARGDDLPSASVSAPAGHVIVRRDLAGVYFVAKPLKEKYDSLIGRVRNLHDDILEARIEEVDARGEIDALEKEIEQVQREIEAREVYVAAVAAHQKSESLEFALGEDAYLFIKAGKVRIVGWDEPHVRCIIEKTVLSIEDQPVTAELNAIGLVHRRVNADELLGGGPQTVEVGDERDLAQRQPFEDFQGNEINVLEVHGLTHQEGNRSISLEVKRKDGLMMSMSIRWRRHAALTLFVPRCKAVGVEGGLKGLHVKSLKASLALSGDGNRDYQATYRVEDLNGSLIAKGIPLYTVARVKGDVSVELTAYIENSGHRHRGDTRTAYVDPAPQSIYTNVEGNFRGWFCKANVHLEGITGQVDVRNDFGETVLVVADQLADEAHRIVSESGHIEVRLAPDTISELPIIAMTECGSVQVPDRQRSFTSRAFSYPYKEGIRRFWRGYVSPDPRPSFGIDPERLSDIQHGRDRSPGLDLVSRAGSVKLVGLD